MKSLIKSQEVSFVGYNGNKLFGRWYQRADDTELPPMVCFHGIGTNCREFGDFPEIIADKGIPVFVFDFSGHGKSEGKRAYFSRGIHEVDTLSAIRYVAKKTRGKLFVMGHSFGSHAALIAITKMSEVKGGVLVAPQIKSGDSLKGLRRKAFFLLGTFYRWFPFLPDIYVSNSTDYKDLFSDGDAITKAKIFDFIEPKISLKVCKYASKVDNRPYMHQVTKPIMLVACGADKQIQAEKIEALSNEVSPVYRKFIVLDGAGHSPFIDHHRDVLAEQIIRFCKEMK